MAQEQLSAVTQLLLEKSNEVILRAHHVWALAILTLYSSRSDPLALEVLTHPFQ